MRIKEDLNIYDFDSISLYLSSWYTLKNTHGAQMGYRVLGKSLGTSSTGYFSKYLDGHISKDSLKRFKKVLRLDSDEYKYFKILVALQKTKLSTNLRNELLSAWKKEYVK